MRSQRREPQRSFARRAPTREPYDVVLIACEGTKTEPNYFKAARSAYRLSSVNIYIREPPGSDPSSIVNFAIEELRHDADYDRVYCVFDRDQHANFDEAMRRAEQSEFAKAERLFVIPSVPCFELWVLLHYRYTTSSYTEAGGQSACERVIRDLRQHLENYDKGHKTIFTELEALLDQALMNADRLEKHNKDTRSINPATRMHHLMKYLKEMRSP
jgi:hypothetical protein